MVIFNFMMEETDRKSKKREDITKGMRVYINLMCAVYAHQILVEIYSFHPRANKICSFGFDGF